MITVDDIITELAKHEIFLTKDDPIIFLIMSEIKLLEKFIDHANDNISTNAENISKRFQTALRNIMENDLESFKNSSSELNESLISMNTIIEENLKRMETINSLNLSILKTLKNLFYLFVGAGLVLVSCTFYFLGKF